MTFDNTTDFLSTLADLKAQVNDLRSTSDYDQQLLKLEHVTVAVARTRQHVASMKNRRASISVLPNEIFVIIFKMGRDMEAVEAGDEMLHPMRLSHISSRWRAISIGIPSLWTTLSTFPHRSMQFFQMLVQRAQLSSLDIHLCDIDSMPTPSDPKYASDILDLALPLIQRWRSLSIVGNSQDDIDDILILLKDASAPRLEEFSVYLVDDQESGGSSSIPVFTGGAGRLSLVQLWGISPVSCRPPWNALTNLNLSGGNPILYLDFCDILEMMSSSLTHLSLDDGNIWPLLNIEPTTVNMLVLQSFHLVFRASGGIHARTILGIIVAPELSYLSFKHLGARAWLTCQPLFDCQHRPPRYPKLRSLHLCDSYQPDILCAFPNITELDITGDMGVRALNLLLVRPDGR